MADRDKRIQEAEEASYHEKFTSMGFVNYWAGYCFPNLDPEKVELAK